MRIAALSDIHGNSIALDAVLADAHTTGDIDAYWIVGDLVAIGFDPIGVLERIHALPNAICTKGNSEGYILNGIVDESPDRPPINEAEWRHQVEISRNFGWTTGMIWSARQQHFLANLPFDHRVVLPDGTRTLAVHASPGFVTGAGFRPDYSEAETGERMNGADADLVLVGHTHWPMNQMVGDVHLVNLGCVSNPNAHLPNAQYVILEADRAGYTIEHRYVEYDRDACVAVCEAERFPGHDFVGMHLAGQFRPKWFSGYDSAELDAFLPIPNKKYKRS